MAFVTNLQGTLASGQFDEGDPSGSRNANITIGLPGGVESGEWGSSNVSVAKVNRDGPDSTAKQNVNNSIIDASKDFNKPASAKIKMTYTSPIFGPGASEDGVDGVGMQTTWTTFQNNDLRAGKFNPTKPPLSKWSSQTSGADLGAYDIELQKDADMDRWAGTDTATDPKRSYFTLLHGAMPQTTVHENPSYKPPTKANQPYKPYVPCKCGYPGANHVGILCETGNTDVCGSCTPIGAKRHIFSGVHGRTDRFGSLFGDVEFTMYTGLWVQDTFSHMDSTVAINGQTYPIHGEGETALDWRHREGAVPCLSGAQTSTLMAESPGENVRRWVGSLWRDDRRCGRNFNKGGDGRIAQDYRLCDYPSGLPSFITCPASQGYEESLSSAGYARGSGRNCAYAHRMRWVGNDAGCGNLGSGGYCGPTGWTQTFYEGDPCCPTTSGKLYGCYIDYSGILDPTDADFDPCWKISTLEPIGQSIIVNSAADSCDCQFRRTRGPSYGADWSGANARGDFPLWRDVLGRPVMGWNPFPVLQTGCSNSTLGPEIYVLASGEDTEPTWDENTCGWQTVIQEAMLATPDQATCGSGRGITSLTQYCASGAKFSISDRFIFACPNPNLGIDYLCCGDTLNTSTGTTYCARKFKSGQPIDFGGDGPAMDSFLEYTGSPHPYPALTGRNWRLVQATFASQSRQSDDPADCTGCGYEYTGYYYDCLGNISVPITGIDSCWDNWSRSGEQDLCASSPSVCSGVFERGASWAAHDMVCYTLNITNPQTDYLVSDEPYFSGNINGSISGADCSWIVPIQLYVDAMPSGVQILALDREITAC